MSRRVVWQKFSSLSFSNLHSGAGLIQTSANCFFLKEDGSLYFELTVQVQLTASKITSPRTNFAKIEFKILTWRIKTDSTKFYLLLLRFVFHHEWILRRHTRHSQQKMWSGFWERERERERMTQRCDLWRRRKHRRAQPVVILWSPGIARKVSILRQWSRSCEDCEQPTRRLPSFHQTIVGPTGAMRLQ